MQLSDPFLQLAKQQLHSLGGTGVLQHLVLYIAQGDQGASTSLVMVEQWPEAFAPLPPAEADPSLRTPVSERRWYPLQHDTLLLGALRAVLRASPSARPTRRSNPLSTESIMLACAGKSEESRNRIVGKKINYTYLATNLYTRKPRELFCRRPRHDPREGGERAAWAGADGLTACRRSSDRRAR